MIEASDEERDSRTVSVGINRFRSNESSEGSRQSSSSRQPERQTYVQDDSPRFVKNDISLSAVDLGIPCESTVSARDSASPLKEDTDNEPSQSERILGAELPKSKNKAAINWNGGTRGTIRTSLGDKKSLPRGNMLPPTTTAFDAVNDRFWRSGSASGASNGSESSYDPEEHVQIGQPLLRQCSEADETEELGSHDSVRYVDDTDDSDPGEVSEGDDAIMLNLGAHHVAPSKSGPHEVKQLEICGVDNYTVPASLSRNTVFENSTELKAFGATNLSTRTKEEDFRLFSEKYEGTLPAILADLLISDLNTHLRHFLHDQNMNKLDLTQPVMCTECWQQGHLNPVCPTRECEHCGAWNVHESRFCPTWRRCQRCRERGHDESRCNSKLRGSAAEHPCDLCGSGSHTELNCDALWKFPHQGPPTGPTSVAISCSHCTSRHHLVGDCPSLLRPLSSSTWTLSGCDPALVTNLNYIDGPRSLIGGTAGMQVRGRANQRPASPESEGDDAVDRWAHRASIKNKNSSGRGGIRVGSGIGKDRNLSSSTNQRVLAGYDPRQAYRDRADILGSRTRQRSFSPDPRPRRPRDQRPKENWNPPRLPQAPRPSRGGPAYRGRGGRQEISKQAYHPIPGGGKKVSHKASFW